MQSIRSKVVLFLLKNRHLLKGQLKKPIINENFSISNFRQEIKKSSELANKRIPDSIKITPFQIETINAEWIIPKGAKEEKILLYIHGGGFISGNCDSHRMHVVKFAQASGYRALLFDYRLAPEYPFPAALEDSITVYQWLLSEGYSAKNIIIGGESAGGTLTLTTTLALKQQAIELPAALFVISPNADLACTAKSFTTNAQSDIAPQGSWQLWTKMYAGNHDLKDPLLSPLYGNFEGFPPMLVTIGTHEIHYNDAIALAQKIKQAGADVILDEWDYMVHAFVIMSPLFPEAKKAMDNIANFIQKHLQ